MNLNISEHIEYNQYKEKLNEIYDKLDEVIYLSNTIDYKKITILLAEIVQNFDYYKHHEEALAAAVATAAAVEEQPQPTATEATEATVATVGGGKGDSGGKEPEQPKKPHSLIDDTTIGNIKDGVEYKRLRSYIEKTKTRIDKKGDKLLELVKTFLEIYFKQLDNNKMNDDFIKQENNLDFKLNDIIANIDRIEHGIQDESTEEAKIYVDLMSNEWRFQWLHNTSETNLDEFVGMWYRCYKKPFVKNIHVIDKAFNSITKEDYKVFVNKLYKDLFVKLHEGFEPLPINHSATFGTIKVLFETNLKEVKEKIKKAKEAEAADTADATDATDTEKAKQPETKQEQPETKTPEVEAIERAFERKKVKAEEIKAIAEAKAIAIKKEKAIAEAKVEEAKAKAEELAQSAQDARNLVLQKRQEATNTLKGMSNMKALQGYAEQLATAKVAKAKQSTDRMNNLLTS